MFNTKRQQDPIDMDRVRINRNKWLTLEIFCGIDNQAIYSQRDDNIPFTEIEIGEKTAFNFLKFKQSLQVRPQLAQCNTIGFMLAFIQIEIAATMFQIELRLTARIKTLDQTFQAGFSCDENNLFVVQT